jgi:hypothetical protein
MGAPARLNRFLLPSWPKMRRARSGQRGEAAGAIALCQNLMPQNHARSYKVFASYRCGHPGDKVYRPFASEKETRFRNRIIGF